MKKEIRWWLTSISLAISGGTFFQLIQISEAATPDGVAAFMESIAPETSTAFEARSSSLLSSSSSRYCPPGRPCPSYPTGSPGVSTGPIVRIPGGRTTGPVSTGPVAARPCPVGTVFDPRIGRCVSHRTPPPSTGPMRPVPARGTDLDEVNATNLVNSAMRGLDCSQAAEALRRLSNQVLSLAASASSSRGTGTPDFKERWRQHIRSPQFWMKVWNKMADAYRSCSRDCFDDGLAVGQISATAYCAASIAVDGLPGPGFLAQPPLPVCETAIHAGCLKGYQQIAGTFEGCSTYTVDRFEGIFAEYQSQDCHL